MTFGNKKSGNGDDISKKNRRITNKGLILTCVLVAGILGASFVVWLIPSDNIPNQVTSNMTVTFRDPNATLISVKSQFVVLQNELQDQINNKTGPDQVKNETEFNSLIDASIDQNNELMMSLLNGNPDQSLMPDYLNLMSEMKNYTLYLSDLKNATSN
ncbi:MAG: hypothetical protein DA329_09475 [Candidatus Nitrosocosmicus sp.]|jgi:hypothetical protein|uniref:hypothetical protein n=1 Tax=Candidatus Nitrosocosmicus sp. FF01 TaxID=3397670 RepID=UPI002A71EAD6|nr:hypothetical protein [Candidatus Nitrosocosmicus sp.]GKS61456.1 hypothetical protein YTPLAS21_09140 [Candidatus Nitrosocosmicus sp.]